MNVILLSGGSGKRLWPLSNEVRSKQFLKVFKREDGVRESMIQRMYRMIQESDENSEITIATSRNQLDSIRVQIGDEVGVSVEPCRRDTFPAIALATAYLCDVRNVAKDEAVVVCPVDPYVESPYFEMLCNLQKQAAKGESNLVLMGVEPTYPSEKYGYIIPRNQDEISFADKFKEKPDAETAKEYIAQGALWNAGVFAYKLSYVLDKAEELFGFSSYDKLFANYENLTKISFDYAVVEKEPNIQAMRFSGVWKDLGTWNTLTEEMADNVTGNATAAYCENTNVINELQIPMVALGINNAVIAATPDGILVTDKGLSDKLKDCVVDQRPMYEKRFWGEYKVLDYCVQENGDNSLTKHLCISPGKHISYQTHKHRTEMWTVIEGTGKIIIEGEIKPIGRGDTACITPGMKHAIKADTELHVIEIQIGEELTEEDIDRLEFEWEGI